MNKVDYSGFMPGYHKAFEAEGIVVAAWCSDKEAVLPPEQVHLVMEIRLDDETVIPIITRFKSPDTLGLIIRQLIEYRREVWSDADLITGENRPPSRVPVIFSRQDLDIEQLVKDWLIDELDEDIQILFVPVQQSCNYQIAYRDYLVGSEQVIDDDWRQEDVKLDEYTIGDRTIIAGYGLNANTLVIGDCSEAL